MILCAQKKLSKAAPCDINVFNFPTWEILEYSELALKQPKNIYGYHTIIFNPLAYKRL